MKVRALVAALLVALAASACTGSITGPSTEAGAPRQSITNEDGSVMGSGTRI